MKRQKATGSRGSKSRSAKKPMPKGMKEMTEKMGSQADHPGGPMAMMQKMMGQMPDGEDKPPMLKMMGMCAEMISSVRQTNALAVYATSELQQAFREWLTELEVKALGILANGADTAELAAALKITEDSTLYLLNRLAASGRITLTAKLK